MESSAEHDFTAFVASRRHVLLRAAYALTGDQHAAEDLVQNALTKAASRWTRIRGEPEHYVRVVIYREFVSGWRRRRRRPESIVAAVPDTVTGDDPTDASVNRLAMRTLIATLPPRQRAVNVLRYLEDMSVDQVAEILGCTRGTVSSQATRALAHLRRHPIDRDSPTRPQRLPAPEATR